MLPDETPSLASASFTSAPLQEESLWQAFPQPKRLVIKLGSQILVDEAGRLAIDRMAAYVKQAAALVAQGCGVVIVSSGAIALGQLALGLKQPLTALEKRACAAAGQARLTMTYEQLFQHYGLNVAQVLLNSRHFAERWHYVNMRKTLETLLALGVVPIVNENDTLAEPVPNSEEVASFGDNDKLSALVAAKLEADGLLILSNVDGLYTANPFENPKAKRLGYIATLAELKTIETQGQSSLGRGGMASKLEAARLASLCGVPTVITTGLAYQSIEQAVGYTGLKAAYPATYIASAGSSVYSDGYKRWLGLASGYAGSVVVNAGAAKALKENNASLLAVGIVAVRGEFLAHQVVSIRDEEDNELGRGLPYFSSGQLQRLAGHPTSAMAGLLGVTPEHEAAIHKDRLVIF
jgi:glutamate 5-kinase